MDALENGRGKRIGGKRRLQEVGPEKFQFLEGSAELSVGMDRVKCVHHVLVELEGVLKIWVLANWMRILGLAGGSGSLIVRSWGRCLSKHQIPATPS